MKSRLLLSILFAAGGLFSLEAKDYVLVDNGKVKTSIVLTDKNCPVQNHAAEELATYLAKISGSKDKVAIGTTAVKGTYPIILKLDTKDKAKADGYTLNATDKGITVSSINKFGILSGSYAILKDNTSIAWVFPGADGEYFKVQPTIKVKSGKKTVNPSFTHRNLSFHAMAVTSQVFDTWNWMARNNLRYTGYQFHFTGKYPVLTREMKKRDYSLNVNPAFSCLLSGYTWGDKRKNPAIDKLFKEHPEYFPVINGKRTKLTGQRYQPCTSNKDVIRISAKNIVENMKKVYSFGEKKGTTVVFNDDGTGWCQCENCKKIDTPRDKKNGFVSNRFWTFMNAMAEEVAKLDKNGELYGMAYQNFVAHPEIKIHPRVTGAVLSFNRLCYRHKVDDPDCMLNRPFHSYYEGWAKKGITLVGREELATHGNHFQPAEETYVHLLKYYKKKNFGGTHIAIAPPDGWYGKKYQKNGKEQWRSMWQTMYLHALYLWDINTDYNKVYEKMNSYYYGKGWEGGMKNFRKLLNETAHSTPGCFGHGFSAPLGRLLDKPLVKERLLKYLEDARKAAAKDPDKRALAHVEFDIRRFNETWIKEREAYVKNYRELRAYEKTAPIKIDGNLDDKDWKNADIISQFKSRFDTSKLAEHQTYMRVVYEPEYFYFAAEMVEPDVKNIETKIFKRDGAVWGDDTIELFLSHPDMGSTYYQFIINSAGTVYDRKGFPGELGDPSFNADIQLKTKILKDRWVVEGRIPTAQLGEKCFTGQSWKMNVLRVRKPKGKQGVGSTLSGGAPFDTGSFLSIAFSGKRGIAPSLHEADNRLWKNGSFNEEAKRPNKNFKDGKAPSGWGFGKYKGGSLAWEPIAPGSPNKVFHGVNCRIMNDIVSKAKNFKVNYRYKGKGTLVFYVYRYDKKNRNRPSKIIHQVKVDAKDWTNGKFEYVNPAEDDTERQVFALHLYGDFYLDEVYLAPTGK